MIYLLIEWLTKPRDLLDPWGLGFLGVFDQIQFRAVFAAIVSFSLVILLGRPTIKILLRLKIGDNPEFYHTSLNELMQSKKNTPTMGGVLIAGAIMVSIVLLADLRVFYIHMALLCLVWLTALGGADDYLKLTSQRRGDGSRDGLFMWEKLVFQVGLAVILGIFIHNFAQNNADSLVKEMAFSLNLPFLKTWVPDANNPGAWVVSPHLVRLGSTTFVVIAILAITGTSNAVNLTDGMDGLASGITAICALSFMILALLAGSKEVAQQLLVPWVNQSDELAIVAGAMLGACLGFLWFNCSPAQVFMGDTGSLPLGGLLGYMAVVTRQEFLLLVVGGVLFAEALSVVMQVGYFRMTGGKRIFKCAPIHHHFHMSGWIEQQVVVRFWLITAILAVVALATIKLR